MTRKSVFRDMDLCVDCKACIVACKVKHGWPPYPMPSIISEPRGLNVVQVYPYGPEIRTIESSSDLSGLRACTVKMQPA